MENTFRLTATLSKINVLRRTPAGVPVLDVMLQHESWQEENGLKCLIKFDLPAKILGREAEIWQHRQGAQVSVGGFLAQRSQKSPYPVLRIQSIQAITQD